LPLPPHIGRQSRDIDATSINSQIAFDGSNICHFSGGKVYQRMPFDRSETIKTLGTKLFTRIKDENERQIIREFLAENQ
jgi:hypothetical protein